MSIITQVALAMIEHEKDCHERISHFLRVTSYARLIMHQETDDSQLHELIELAALTHDIGIKPSLENHNSSAGHWQEKEGPPLAKAMLAKTDLPEDIINRVCWLIGHHHTVRPIEGIDHQILIEADYLVNSDDGNVALDTIRQFRDQYFRTAAGTELLNSLHQLC